MTLPTRQTSVLFVLLSCSLVLYAYRFFVVIANVSPFRIVLAAWVLSVIVDVARGRIWFSARDRVFIGLCAVLTIVNLEDFVRLSAYPNLRRDIFNHLANLCLAAIVALTVRTERDINRLAYAFIASSVLAAAITVSVAVMGHLPFESLVRAGARDLTIHDAYTYDDSFFRRDTSAFLDPNLYGVYCALVLICIMYCWLYVKRSRTLAILFALNLVFLDLTLSRTAVIGFIAGLALVAWLEVRVRRFALVVLVISVALLPTATLIQSHAYRSVMVRNAAKWYSDASTRVVALFNVGRSTSTVARSSSGTAHKAKTLGDEPSAQVVAERAINGKSLQERTPYILNALRVVREHPLAGGSSASLQIAQVPWATAHIWYLSVLARYGVIGAIPYFTFMAYPFAFVLVRRAELPQSQVFLVTGALGTLFVVYLSYDIFFYFEVQYLFFGIAYSVVLNQPGRMSAQSRHVAELV